MDLHTLRFFLCVADQGSFTAASEALHYAQSNLSTQIKNLEEELKTPLFYRKKRGVVLTAKGKLFYDYASRILKLTDESVMAVQDQDTARGHLTFGSLEAIALRDLPELFSSYHKNYPEVTLTLTTDMNDVFPVQVLNRTLDGAFIQSPGKHPDLNEIFIKKEELVLVGGIRQHHMTAFDILKEAPIITFPQGSIFRHRLEQLMASLALSYSGGFTILNSLAAMIVNIISGLGYGYLPRSIINPYIDQGIMQEFPLADPYSELDIVFIYRKDHLMDAAFRYFIDMLNK